MFNKMSSQERIIAINAFTHVLDRLKNPEKAYSWFVCDLVYHWRISEIKNDYRNSLINNVENMILSEIKHRIEDCFSIGEWLQKKQGIAFGKDRVQFDKSEEMRQYRILWVESMIAELKNA